MVVLHGLVIIGSDVLVEILRRVRRWTLGVRVRCWRHRELTSCPVVIFVGQSDLGSRYEVK